MKYLIIVLILLQSPMLKAQDFSVSSSLDTLDLTPGDGICADTNGECSLRAAIMESNANSDQNTINLERGQTYKITRPNVTNTEIDGDLDIYENLIIQIINPHLPIQSIAELPTIDADGLDRVFQIDGAAFVTFDGLRIINGDATIYGSQGGGAVLVEDTVNTFTLKNSVIEHNKATSGAGLHLKAASSLIERTDISNNQTSTAGGQVQGVAIFQELGSLQLHRSSIHHNSRGEAQPGCVFAVDNYLNASSITVLNSTVSNNGSYDPLSCIGGIRLLNVSGVFNNITVVKNAGAGIHFYDDPNDMDVYSVKLRNVLLDNRISNCSFPGGITDTGDHLSGYNISTDSSCQLIESQDNGNHNLANLNLHPGRSKYGLGTYFWYHEPIPSSPAIDNGSPLTLEENDDEACALTDQIGSVRNIDGDEIGNAICDSGAIEYNLDLLFYSGIE